MKGKIVSKSDILNKNMCIFTMGLENFRSLPVIVLHLKKSKNSYYNKK